MQDIHSEDHNAEEHKQGPDGWRASTHIKIGLTCFLTFLACILVFFLLYRYQGLTENIGDWIKSAESIIIGLALAYLLNPVMHFFERQTGRIVLPRMKSEKKALRISRGVGIFGAILVLVLVIALLIAAIVPSVVSSIVNLTDTLPRNIDRFLRWVQSLTFVNEEVTAYVRKTITEATTYIEDWATKDILPQAQTYITHITSGVYSVFKSILNFVIGIIVAIYVMAIQETLIGQSKKILYAVFKPKRANLIIEVTREAHRIFGGFITGKLLDSLIIGCICYVGCMILHMPYTVLIAAIVGVTNIIPFFGPIIGAIPCIFLVLVQSPIQALYLAIFVIALQQVDGNIIGPKILGDSTGLSSFWVMFAILIGGGNFGFPGMVLGVPVMGVVYYVVRRLANYGVRRRGLPENTADYVKVHSVDVETNTLVYHTQTFAQDEPSEQQPPDGGQQKKVDS